jgi:hypothetical protein
VPVLFHVSIDADDPRHVAHVLAEIWGGTALPFPPVIAGSWMAMAGDDRNTMIEVYPRATELVEAEGDDDGYGVIGSNNARSATHLAMATAMSVDEVLALAAREGWPAKYRKRGGAFGVLEVWIEGSRMLEVLTPEMQGEYLRTMTVSRWTGALTDMGVLEAA